MSLKYTLQRFRWIKALWSPFKPFKIGFYAGKLAIGTPYFFPRKWIKYTEEDIQKAILDASKRYEIARKLGPSRDSCFLANDISAFALKHSRAEEYTKWKSTAKKDCEQAGWPAD